MLLKHYLLLASVYLWIGTPAVWPFFLKHQVLTAVICYKFVELFLKSSSHLFTDTRCWLYIKCITVYSYLFLCPADAVYLFKEHSIGLTVALDFSFWLKGCLSRSHTAATKWSPLHPAQLMQVGTMRGLRYCLPHLIFHIDSRGKCSPPSWRSSELLCLAHQTAPCSCSLAAFHWNNLIWGDWNHISSSCVNSSSTVLCQLWAAASIAPSQVRPRALGHVQVSRADQKAFFSRTCRNRHSILLSQVSFYMVLLISASCLVLHDTSITLQRTAGRRLKAALGVTLFKKQDLLGERGNNCTSGLFLCLGQVSEIHTDL